MHNNTVMIFKKKYIINRNNIQRICIFTSKKIHEVLHYMYCKTLVILRQHSTALFGTHTKKVIRTKLKKFSTEQLDLFQTI